MRIPKVVLVTWITLLCQSSFAQSPFHKGFIITHSGDTVDGYVKTEGKSFAPVACHFKVNDNVKVERFTAADIAGFGVNDLRSFKVLNIGEGLQFFQTLVLGKVSLYSSGKRYFIERDSVTHPLIQETTKVGNSAVRKKKTYIGTLRVVLSDCQSISGLLDGVDFNEASLTDVIQKYNTCVGATQIVPKAGQRALEFQVSPVLGLAYSKLSFKIDPYSQTLSYLNSTPTFGVALAISNASLIDNLSLLIEARYNSSSHKDVVTFRGYTYDRNSISLSNRYLSLPIAVEYNVHVNRKTSIFFKGGLLFAFNLESNFSITQHQSDYPSVPSRTVTDFEYYGSQTSFVAGIGARVNVKNRQMSIELRRERTEPIKKTSPTSLICNSYMLLVGYPLSKRVD